MIRNVGGPSGPQKPNRPSFQGRTTADKAAAITLPAIASLQRSASAMGQSLKGRAKVLGSSPLTKRVFAAARRHSF